MKWLSLLLSVVLFVFAFIPAVRAETAGVSADQVSTVKKSDDFKDLQNMPQEVKAKFDALLRDGVFNGVSDDSFGADEYMNRAQFAKVAAIIFSLPINKALTTSSFADVSADDPANGYALPYIEALKTAGLTNGIDAEGKLYNPGGTVTRQELAAFLVRGLKWEDAAKRAVPIADSTVDGWAKGYVTLAIAKNLMAVQADGSFGGKSLATRSMLALASYEARLAVGTAAPDVPTLPDGISVLPAAVEIGQDINLSAGDKYYDADGSISARRQLPTISLELTGPQKEEFTPSQIETLYDNGYIEVSATGGIVLDTPAIGRKGAGLGKIVIREVTAEGDASVTVKLPQAGQTATQTFSVSPMRVPASVAVSPKEVVLLAENDQPQGLAFTVKDQYGKDFAEPSSLDGNSYMIEYKLERLSGLPSLQSAGGIFDVPWDEQQAASLNSADADKRVQTWRFPLDKSGDANKFMFKANHSPVGTEGSRYKITATVVNAGTGQEIASASANVEVYNWKDLDPKMMYELDVHSDHFASGKYLFERSLLSSPKDIGTLNAKYRYYGKELNIRAYDDKGRQVDMTKVLRDEAGNPVSIVQNISTDASDALMGAQSVNAAGIPVFRVYGIQPTELFSLDAMFYTPNGIKTLTKKQMTVADGEPVAKAVALKNINLSFNLNTVYKIRKEDGSIEQVKGSDYLESRPYVWEFLKFCDNNGRDTKDESNFFKYFIQATDQFGHKYQNTSDNKITDFMDNIGMLKVQAVIDTDNKNPPKWSVKDETLKDKIWIDDQFRIHYEPHARKPDGSFDYSKANLQSFSIELITPTLQRAWCTVTLN